jgi:hypothetical protein
MKLNCITNDEMIRENENTSEYNSLFLDDDCTYGPLVYIYIHSVYS